MGLSYGFTKSVVEGTAAIGRPRKIWQNSVSANLSLEGFNLQQVQDGASVGKAIGRNANLVEPGNTTVKHRVTLITVWLYC